MNVVLIGFLVLKLGYALEFNVGGKVPKFDRFNGMCRGNKDTKVTFDYTGIRCENNKLLMNYTITIKEDVLNPPTMSMKIQRCRSKENPDSCENFFTFKTKKYCEMLESTSDMWTPFFATIEPKLRCPMRKGVYKSINSMIDIKSLLLFPVDGWFWKADAEMRDSVTNKKIMCMKVEASVHAKST